MPQQKTILIEQGKFGKGYVSFYEESITPTDAVVEALNMELVQDARWRPRPSTVPYGAPYLGECIGQGTFIKIILGLPENWEISMQVIGGVGKVCTRKDGGTWNVIGGSYTTSRWTNFCPGNKRVMVSNKNNTMSYYDINTNSIVAYEALANPATPTTAVTGVSGTTYTYYVRYTAEGANGETAKSAAATFQTSKLRDAWAGGTTEYATYNGTAVTNAVYYNWYIGDAPGEERWVATTSSPVFKDDATQAINPIRKAPVDNSTAGPILEYMWYSGSQFWGVGDKDNAQYLWYSGTGMDAGSWSPFLGGGWVGIDYGGSTVPVGGLGFHDGKGTSAITVLSKGAAGGGLMNHVVFNSITFGENTMQYPEVYPANGQAGAYGSRCIIENNNDIHYLTGLDSKKTGTQTNVVNILSTSSTGQAIEKDFQNFNLSALGNACGVEFMGANYWAVPVGSDTNNRIYKNDLTRGGAWMVWEIAAKHLWKYEDNSGNTHLLALVNNKAVEFTRNVLTQDDGVVFPTRLRTGGLTWDKSGQSLADVEKSVVKLLHPVGEISASASGLDEDLLPTGNLSADTFTQTIDFTGWNETGYNILAWNEETGVPQASAQSVGYLLLEPDETLNQLEIEITTNSPSDYVLASILTPAELTGEYIGD